jgi:WD40 repeat protein
MSGFGGVVDKPTTASTAGVGDADDADVDDFSNGGGGAADGGNNGADSAQSLITLRKSLGISGFCQDNVVFSAPTTIAYPLGKQIVFHDLLTGEMRYLARSRTARKVTAMAIDSTVTSLAVCEQSSPEGRAQIHIIHCSMMKKSRTIMSQVAGDIVCCAFASSGSRELATLSQGTDDYVITVWKWSQSKVIASASTNVNMQAGQRIRRLRFNPTNTQMTTSGSKHLRLWTVDAPNNTLKPTPLLLGREQDNFIDHVWLKGSGCLVVLTAERILSFKVSAEGQAREYGAALEGSFQRMQTMVAHGPKAFILGGKGANFSVYEFTGDPAEPFMHLKLFTGGALDNIMSMAVAPNHDNVVCYLEGQHLSLFPISNIDLLKTEDNNFQKLIHDGIHSDAITSMDTCFQRPIVITAGRDRRINIWDYRNWECLLSDEVTDEPTCIACHPGGTMLLVGSKERVRFYNILSNKLSLFVEVPNVKNCRQAQFSHGGQYFAVTAGLNILVYLTYELRCVRTLTGHISPPTCLLWSQDDALFFSAGADGGVYGWNVEDNVRLEEFDINIAKCDRITGLACSADKTRLVVVGNDSEVHQIINGERSDFDTDVALTRVCIPRGGKCMFAGTEAGTVRVYPWPLPREGAQRMLEIPVHDGPVTHLQLSPDQKWLISAADDSVFAFQVDREFAKLDYKHYFNGDMATLLQEDLNDTNARVRTLSYQIKEVETQSGLTKHFLEKQAAEELKAQEEQFTRAMDIQKRNFMALEAQLTKHKMQTTDERSQQDAEHVKLTQKMESEYEHKLGVEMLRFDKLSEDMETLTQRCEEALQKQEDVLRSEITRIKKEHADVTRQLLAEKQELQAKLSETVRVNEEVLRQVTSEYEEEIQNLKVENLQQKIAESAEEAARDQMLQDGKNMAKKHEQKMEELKHQMAAQETKMTRLEQKNRETETILQAANNTISEMEASMAEKEAEIRHLRNNNRKLDNFRYVLDDKIQELQKERGPVNAHIQKLESHIRDMYEELVEEFNDKKHLDRVMNNKMLTIESLTNEVSKLRSENREKTRTIQALCHGLTKAIQHAMPRDTVDVVKRLYRTFVQTDGNGKPERQGKGGDGTGAVDSSGGSTVSGSGRAKGAGGEAGDDGSQGGDAEGGGGGSTVDESELLDNAATVQEALRQRRHMERTTATLKHALKMKEDQLHTQAKLGLGQNSLLINECNNLRKENKHLKTNLHKAEERLKVLERARKKREAAGGGGSPTSSGGASADGDDGTGGAEASSSAASFGDLAPVQDPRRGNNARRAGGSAGATPFQRRQQEQQQQHLGGAIGGPRTGFGATSPTKGGRLGHLMGDSGAGGGSGGSAGGGGGGMRGRLGLAHGSTKNISENALQQAKMSTLLRQLDENQREMDMQRIEIRRLREQVKLLVQQLGPELEEPAFGGHQRAASTGVMR